MAGEDAHEAGRDGLQRAKRWLELTTRVSSSWTHRDPPLSELLEFHWPQAKGAFSYDLGGTFRGGEFTGRSFVAEVKKYRREADLPTHFRDFLAKNYVALDEKPARCHHFLWISWSPFQAQKWDSHASAESVKKAVLHPDNCLRVLGVQPSEGESKLDPELLAGVAGRTWLVTLGDEQEKLVLSAEHYIELQRIIAAQGVAS